MKAKLNARQANSEPEKKYVVFVFCTIIIEGFGNGFNMLCL